MVIFNSYVSLPEGILPNHDAINIIMHTTMIPQM